MISRFILLFFLFSLVKSDCCKFLTVRRGVENCTKKYEDTWFWEYTCEDGQSTTAICSDGQVNEIAVYCGKCTSDITFGAFFVIIVSVVCGCAGLITMIMGLFIGCEYSYRKLRSVMGLSVPVGFVSNHPTKEEHDQIPLDE